MSDLIGKVTLTDMADIVNLSMPFLEMGKEIKFTVVGNSMHPLFCNQRDKVIVAKAQKVKKRDVILYRRQDGSYILHRVVGKGKLGFKLCGDDQIAIEYPVKREDIIAVMTSFERKGKTYSKKCLWYRIYSFLWCLLLPIRPSVHNFAMKFRRKKRNK